MEAKDIKDINEYHFIRGEYEVKHILDHVDLKVLDQYNLDKSDINFLHIKLDSEGSDYDSIYASIGCFQNSEVYKIY
tara:strand:+ start:62 stop:292 length:231 start_codon:yes stop_codon:yes gene_type:complete